MRQIYRQTIIEQAEALKNLIIKYNEPSFIGLKKHFQKELRELYGSNYFKLNGLEIFLFLIK